MTVRDPIPTLDAIDRAMRNHAGDPERFNDICLARERIHAQCEDIAESVAAFLRGAYSSRRTPTGDGGTE